MQLPSNVTEQVKLLREAGLPLWRTPAEKADRDARVQALVRLRRLAIAAEISVSRLLGDEEPSKRLTALRRLRSRLVAE